MDDDDPMPLGSGGSLDPSQSQSDVLATASSSASLARDAKLFRRLDFSLIRDCSHVRASVAVFGGSARTPKCCVGLCSVLSASFNGREHARRRVWGAACCGRVGEQVLSLVPVLVAFCVGGAA
jgi:hypothetical protein